MASAAYDDKIVAFRSRRERSADDTLGAAEDLRDAIEGLRLLAADAVSRAVESGLPPESVAALRSAADLVVKAGDVLATTLVAAVPEAAET